MLVVDTFRTEKEVLQRANDTEYGLGAYVDTTDMDRAKRLSKALEAGSVVVSIDNSSQGVTWGKLGADSTLLGLGRHFRNR